MGAFLIVLNVMRHEYSTSALLGMGKLVGCGFLNPPGGVCHHEERSYGVISWIAITPCSRLPRPLHRIGFDDMGAKTVPNIMRNEKARLSDACFRIIEPIYHKVQL
jgi:hypothetical protein